MTPASQTARQRIGIQLVGLARRWRQALDARLSSSSLSDATWAPLMHLHELGDGLQQSQLAAAVGVDGSSLVRLLDILVGQGLIERRPHPVDRRIKLVYLTPEGRQAVVELREHLQLIETELLADLDDPEAESFLNALAKIDARIASSAGRSAP